MVFMKTPTLNSPLSPFCMHPVQNILNNHMQPVKGVLASAGSCSILLTLIVLGAYFYVPPKEVSGTDVQKMLMSTSMESLADSFKDLVFFKRKRKTRSSSVSLSNEPVFPSATKTVLSRMIIMPLLLMPLMAMLTKFDWHKVLDK
jgi:hypothetical protein